RGTWSGGRAGAPRGSELSSPNGLPCGAPPRSRGREVRTRSMSSRKEERSRTCGSGCIASNSERHDAKQELLAWSYSPIRNAKGRELLAEARRRARGASVLGRERSGDLRGDEQPLAFRLADLLHPDRPGTANLAHVGHDLEGVA